MSTATTERLKEGAEPGLVDDLDPNEFPFLAKMLQSPAGIPMACELAKLMARRPRAVRRNVELLGRLDGAGFQETVRLRDVSATGARLRMARRGRLDLMTTDTLRLRCRVLCDDVSDCSDLDVAVALVRVVELSEDHAEFGFRFLDVGPAQRNILHAIERLYFFQ